MQEVMTEEKRPRGRPCSYTPEIGQLICDRLAKGEGLNAICKDDGMPAESTVRGWALDNVGGFFAIYARARELQAEKMAEEIIAISDASAADIKGFDENGDPIADHEFIARAKLRVDTRKWILSKVLPKKYGESTTIKGDKDNPLTVQALSTALDDRVKHRIEHKED